MQFKRPHRALYLPAVLVLDTGAGAAAGAAAARSFFVANRRVCADWLGRIRGKLLRAALRARRPASVVRHGQIRLAELHARAARAQRRTSRVEFR